MLEESSLTEQENNEKKCEFGPLKAAKNEDYQIEGEDWGGLKPQAAKKKLKIGDKVGEFGTYMGERGIYDSRNSLNDLTGKEWAIFTKSWFVHNPSSYQGSNKLFPSSEACCFSTITFRMATPCGDFGIQTYLETPNIILTTL